MTGITKRIGLTAAFALLAGLSATAGAPSAAGQAPAAEPTVTVVQGELSGPVQPLAGTDGFVPSASAAEAGPAPTPAVDTGATPVEASPAGAESVIGPDGRVRVTNTMRRGAIGQIEYHQDGLPPPLGGGGDYLCTGWLIDLNSLLTSGHCVYDPTTSAGAIESATFYPARNGASNPYGGCAVASSWSPPIEWRMNGQPYWDFGVMNLANVGDCATIGEEAGFFGTIAYAGWNALNGMPAIVRGYPGDKPFGTQWSMSGRIAKANKRMAFYPMDTEAGQSGAPVYRERPQGAAACSGPCGMAVHGYTPGLPGGGNNNAGPRLTAFRLGQIFDFAGQNDPP